MKRMRTQLLLLLVLAYSGQVLAASAFSCADMAPASGGLDTAGMAHAGHVMPADEGTQSTAPVGACCDGGLCDMGHCQSAPALPLDHPDGNQHVVSFYAGFAATSSPLRPADSLYRPPISR